MKNISATQSDSEGWQSRVQRCCATGDISGALNVALNAVATDPDDLNVLHALAVLYLAAGRSTDAVPVFQSLLQRDMHADRYFDLGVALEAAGDLSAARAGYEKALELEPTHFKARLNLCALLLMLRLSVCAVNEAALLVQTHPQLPDAWCSLGHAQFANFNPGAADAAFARAQSLAPGHLPAAFGRVVSLAMCGEFFGSNKLQAELRALHLPSALVSAIPQASETLALSQNDCDDIYLTALFERYRRGEWECLPLLHQGLSQLAAKVRQDTERRMHSVHAFNALAIGLDYADYRVVARRVAAGDTEGIQPRMHQPRAKENGAPRRLRLGFISPAFRDHPSAYLIRNTFRHHDRTRFSVHAYCLGVDDGSEVRRDIISGCDTFVSLSALTDQEAAQRIHDDGIDILVQFQGFFDGTRNGILQMRPAPVRVAHIGVVGALDATYVDYRFCEALADQFDAPTNPPGEDVFEKRIRFSELYIPYGAPTAPWSIPVSRSDCGLPERAFVFCSFNTDYKINEETFVAWLQILRATPGSILWLRATDDGLWNRCQSCAQSHGIAPSRIIRAKDCSNNQHLARMRLADLFLDSFAYNAHTTALDALWMGLPILTREGQTPVSLLCAVILRQMGLNELITRTTDEYIAVAIALAADKVKYQAVVRKLMSARSSSKVFDTSYKVRLYESAYETMWARHTAGLPPADFDVPPLNA
jgi:predicted O-linked N-acetylglucosamine transferase (SPINDLY family)